MIPVLNNLNWIGPDRSFNHALRGTRILGHEWGAGWQSLYLYTEEYVFEISLNRGQCVHITRPIDDGSPHSVLMTWLGPWFIPETVRLMDLPWVYYFEYKLGDGERVNTFWASNNPSNIGIRMAPFRWDSITPEDRDNMVLDARFNDERMIRGIPPPSRSASIPSIDDIGIAPIRVTSNNTEGWTNATAIAMEDGFRVRFIEEESSEDEDEDEDTGMDRNTTRANTLEDEIKFHVCLLDPSGLEDSLREAAMEITVDNGFDIEEDKDAYQEEYNRCLSALRDWVNNWFKENIITLEFDTSEGTCRVLRSDGTMGRDLNEEDEPEYRPRVDNGLSENEDEAAEQRERDLNNWDVYQSLGYWLRDNRATVVEQTDTYNITVRLGETSEVVKIKWDSLAYIWRREDEDTSNAMEREDYALPDEDYEDEDEDEDDDWI